MNPADNAHAHDHDHDHNHDHDPQILPTPDQIAATFEEAWHLRQDDRAQCQALTAQAHHWATTAVDALTPAEAERFDACYLTLSAHQDMQTGHLSDGLPKALQAHQVFQKTDHTDWLSRVLNLLGIFYIQLGNRTLATEYWLANAKLSAEHRTEIEAARAYHNLGWLPYQAGDYAEAIPYFKRSLPVIRTAGNNHHLALNLCNLATCLAHQGALTEAQLYLDEALELCRAHDELAVEENVTLQRLGLLAEKRGTLEQALDYYLQALAITEHTPDPFSRIPNLHAIARIYIELGRAEEAYDYLADALRQSTHADRKQYLYDTHELLSKLYQATGELDKALEHFQQFHAIRTEVFNEANEQTVHNLRIIHQTETVRREADLLKSQNELLESKVAKRTRELSQLLEEREALTRKLVQVLAREEELSSLKSQIITTVSHEFRTPLTVISTSSDLLKRYIKTVTPPQAKHFKRIQEAVHYITGLLNDIALVHTTTSASEEIVVRRSRRPFNQLWTQLQDYMLVEVGDPPNLQVEFEARDDRDLSVDITLLKQIVINLLSNALKYSPSSAPVILRSYLEHEQLVIQVIDEGIGIPLPEQDKIFALFYRASNAEEQRGLGLGLFIVRELSKLLGGQATAVSAGPGQGSSFTVTLPITETPYTPQLTTY